MTRRLIICLSLSVLIHVLVLAQPWNLMAPAAAREHQDESIPVELVEDAQPRELVPVPEEPLPSDVPEGVSFEALGEVSADYLELLKAKIFNAWEYPREAIDAGADGIVRLRFVLDSLGEVIEIGVLSGSGNDSLDSAAADAVLEAGPFGPFTEEISPETLTITGTFRYVLD
jgi:TonB family protein